MHWSVSHSAISSGGSRPWSSVAQTEHELTRMPDGLCSVSTEMLELVEAYLADDGLVRWREDRRR